jgi:maltose O-acetyltransferase
MRHPDATDHEIISTHELETRMSLEEQRQLLLSGKMYNDLTPELVQARERAVILTNEYNNSFGKGPQERLEILKKLLKKVGDGVHFEPNFRCEFGFNISIGNSFYANFDCIILDGGGVEIGDNVLFGPRVGIYTSNHAVDASERVAGACYAKPVKIENRVWIGAGVHINHGVTIGDNTIIGAGSVVTKDVPANVIAAGVPCRVIRQITDSDKSGFKA